MGGRGSSSGVGGAGGRLKTSGLEVTTNGETTEYIFSSINGENYYQKGFGSVPEPTPLNMTAKEFKKRVEANGATTKVIGSKEMEKKERGYWEKERNKPDYELGVGLKDNREYRRTSRKNRLISREIKKK